MMKSAAVSMDTRSSSSDVSLALDDSPRTKQLKDLRQKRLNYYSSASYVLLPTLIVLHDSHGTALEMGRYIEIIMI